MASEDSAAAIHPAADRVIPTEARACPVLASAAECLDLAGDFRAGLRGAAPSGGLVSGAALPSVHHPSSSPFALFVQVANNFRGVMFRGPRIAIASAGHETYRERWYEGFLAMALPSAMIANMLSLKVEIRRLPLHAWAVSRT